MNGHTVIILLVWQRIQKLEQTLTSLANQTDRNFDIHITNGNIDYRDKVDRIADSFKSKGLHINVSHDGNDYSTFRRFFVAKKYAEMGYDRVFFLDDDILIPKNYIKNMLAQYKPQTYFSGYAWRFFKSPKNYWKDRTRVHDATEEVHYGGAGISMMDISLFKDERLFDVMDPLAYQIDDLWLSYFCKCINKWPIVAASVSGVVIGGGDSVALYRKLKNGEKDQKTLFLHKLIKEVGWDLL
jgi:glycosyltransferase involved in cell wall biosynthesis